MREGEESCKSKILSPNLPLTPPLHSYMNEGGGSKGGRGIFQTNFKALKNRRFVKGRFDGVTLKSKKGKGREL
jgi:hypothetical protein